MPGSETASAAASVRVGGYSLDVGKGPGSFARFEPTEERENARDLRAALKQDETAVPAPVAAVEQCQETADAVTSRIEQAHQLLTAAADRQLLDPGNVTSEIDALLDLFGRLDRAGRFEEQLKLMRSLNGLLALTLRWLDLIRSLRALLRSATAAGHEAGQALAHHELGSLHLCAGRSKDAAKHLSEALRIERKLGDFASQCATRHNLDSAHRDTLARRAWRRSRRQLGYSILVAAAFVLLGGGGGTGLALAIRGGGGGGGGVPSVPSGSGKHSPATLAIHADYEPVAPAAPVEVAVACKGGRPDKSSRTATEATPARFSIHGVEAGGTCTATEPTPPTGYVAIERGCRNVPIPRGGSASCVIVNTRKSPTRHGGGGPVTLTVFDDSPAPVGIALSCDSGTVRDTQPSSSRGSPARFSISGFSSGATCAAAEKTTPSGYSTDETNCQRVTITSGGAPECTIVDTLNSTTLTVRIDYSDATTSPVYVTLDCPSGTVSNTSRSAGKSQLASPSAPGTFTVSGFDTGTTCSATEDKVPGGYDADPSDCQNVVLGSKSECTIVNSVATT